VKETLHKNRKTTGCNFRVSSYSALFAVSIVIRTIKHFPKGSSFLFNNLREYPGSSRKKPNVGRSLTGRLSTAHVNSHMPSRAPAVLCFGLEKLLSGRNGHGMVCVNQARPHCVNKIGKTQYKPLQTRPGRGTAWYV